MNLLSRPSQNHVLALGDLVEDLLLGGGGVREEAGRDAFEEGVTPQLLEGVPLLVDLGPAAVLDHCVDVGGGEDYGERHFLRLLSGRKEML